MYYQDTDAKTQRVSSSGSDCTQMTTATSTNHTKSPSNGPVTLTSQNLSSVVLPTSTTDDTSRLDATSDATPSEATSQIPPSTPLLSQPTTLLADSFTASLQQFGTSNSIRPLSVSVPMIATTPSSRTSYASDVPLPTLTATYATDVSTHSTVVSDPHPNQLTKKGVSGSVIAGGIVAAVLALCIIVAVLLYMRRRARQERDGWKRQSYETSLRETSEPGWESNNYQNEADPERAKVVDHHLSGHTITDAASDLEYVEPNYGYPREKMGYAL
ncbi:hypothetical protein BJ165DRAFT_1408520 [Panaeolus papilionaceus]|nr:hypothetical protein BJ165DRAFT_1408520 [Panaeolus papilionaceus]